MSFLLDADWTISFLNGRANAIRLIEKLADEGLALSIITWGEICEGLLSRPDPPRHITQFEQFTASLDLITPDLDVARHYATIRSRLRSRGELIPDNDTWIAATALAHNLTLVSRDAHFSRIPDLKLYLSS